MTTMIMLHQGITDVITKMKTSNTFLKITPLYTHDFSQLIQDIDAINKITQEITLDIPTISLCNMLYGFIDSFYLTDFNELQQMGDPIDYINFQTNTIFFTKIHSDMKKQMEDIKNQIIAKPIAIFTNNYPVTKYMNILNILIIYLNNIKQQDITMFKRIMPYQYSFQFFIIYMSYMHIFSIITDTAPDPTRQAIAIRDVENLMDLILKILKNLLFENTCDINRTYNRDETYVKIYTQLQSELQSELQISDDLYNLIDCLKFLFEESNQKSKDKGLITIIYITDLHALFNLGKWDTNFRLINDMCNSFHRLLSTTEYNDFCMDKISDIIEELRKLNYIFKAGNKLVHILSLLCIYIKLLLLKNIYKEMNSGTPNPVNTDKMTELLQERISPLKFIKKYIALISKSPETLVTFEPDKPWIAERDKTYKTLERLGQISDSSSRVGSSLAASRSSAHGSSSSAHGSRSSAHGSSSSAHGSSSSAHGSSSSAHGSSSSAHGSSSSAHGSSLGAHGSSSSAHGSSSSAHGSSLGDANLSLARPYTISQQFIDFPFKRSINDINDFLPLVIRNQYETCMKINSLSEMILFKDSSSPRTHSVTPSNIGIQQGLQSCYFNSLYQLLFCIEEFKNYVSSPSFINEQNDSFASRKLKRDSHNIFTKSQDHFTRFITYIKKIFSKDMSGNNNPIWCETFINIGTHTFGRSQQAVDEALSQLIHILKYNGNQEIFKLFEYTMEDQTFIYDLDDNIIECKSIKDPHVSASEEDVNTILQISITKSADLVTLLNDFFGLSSVTANLIIDPKLGVEAVLRTTNEHAILSHIFLGEYNDIIIPFIKKYYIARPIFNKYIIIHFKRLIKQFDESVKIYTEITINKQMLISNNLYILVGAIIHNGDATGGHYVFHFYHSNNTITIYNENSVTTRQHTQSDDNNLHTNGVMFLYIKQDGHPGGGIKSKINEKFDKVHSTSSKPYFIRGTMGSPDNETSSFFPKKKDELTLECVQSTHSNETKWKQKYLKYKQKYLKLANK